MTEAEEDLIYELGEWQMSISGMPVYNKPTIFNCNVKWIFVFNNEILN